MGAPVHQVVHLHEVDVPGAQALGGALHLADARLAAAGPDLGGVEGLGVVHAAQQVPDHGLGGAVHGRGVDDPAAVAEEPAQDLAQGCALGLGGAHVEGAGGAQTDHRDLLPRGRDSPGADAGAGPGQAGAAQGQGSGGGGNKPQDGPAGNGHGGAPCAGTASRGIAALLQRLRDRVGARFSGRCRFRQTPSRSEAALLQGPVFVVGARFSRRCLPRPTASRGIAALLQRLRDRVEARFSGRCRFHPASRRRRASWRRPRPSPTATHRAARGTPMAAMAARPRPRAVRPLKAQPVRASPPR